MAKDLPDELKMKLFTLENSENKEILEKVKWINKALKH
jgi:hypothetical protein